MNPRTTLLRVAATSGLAAVLCGLVAAPAVAAEGDVDVLNTETVQVYTSPTGEIETRRVYEQLVLTGTGSVDVANPISTDGLRNLEGFGGFDVEDGEQITNMTVDGEEHLRSVSDYEGDLPLDVSVAYTLDGETVEPGDIVGESGELEVRYTVKNITGQPQEVSFPDGSGGTTTETVDVPIPMVGSLTTTAPENFTNVRSDQANIAGDGKGGTKLSFTMTLFPPIGSDTAEFGYTADVVDGVVPRSDVSALPVNPLESPTFASAADSYQGGTDTGAKLAEGAATIDSNLLKLRDGAAELLAGLIKLHDGSERLQAGLAEEAAPGAAKLAEGTGQAADGADRLADGAGRLDDGLGQLDGGVGDLSSGADRLAAGQRRLADGLELLYDGVDALPPTVKAELAKNKKYQALTAGLEKMLNGVGSASQAGSLTWGVDQVRSGLQSEAVPGLTRMKTGIFNQSATAPGAVQKLNCAIKVLTDVRSGTAPGVGDPCYVTAQNPTGQRPGMPGFAAPTSADQSTWSLDNLRYYVLNNVVTGLQAGLPSLYDTNPANNELPAGPSLYEGIDMLLAGLTSQDPADPGAIPALSTIECALDNTSLGDACETIRPGEVGLRQGLEQVSSGVPLLVSGILANIEAELLANIGRPTPGCDTSETLRCGAAALAAGGGDLTAGVDKLVAGVDKLAAGGSLLSAGAGDLSDGLGQIDDGAGRLAQGLTDAAVGSGKLTAGLGKASGGAPKLVDGAKKLSDKGTSKLVEAGEDTTQTYGQMYATMQAGAERAQTEDMAYGAPEGATGLTAYSYIIQGEDGETSRNWARGLAGMALLGLGGGGFLLRRRLV